MRYLLAVLIVIGTSSVLFAENPPKNEPAKDQAVQQGKKQKEFKKITAVNKEAKNNKKTGKVISPAPKDKRTPEEIELSKYNKQLETLAAQLYLSIQMKNPAKERSIRQEIKSVQAKSNVLRWKVEKQQKNNRPRP